MNGKGGYGLKHVIWDFNGTILDDLELAVESLNSVLRARDLPVVTVGEHRERFRFPVSEYYRDLGLEVDGDSFAALSDEYHEYYMRYVSTCPLHEGVVDLMGQLADRGVHQYLLSAMHEPLLMRCVESLGIESHFEAIYGLDDRLAQSKVLRGRELCDAQGIDAERAVLIGDTEHDVEVARDLGVLPVAAAWGHQAPGMFDANVALLADSPSEAQRLLAVERVIVA